MPRLFPTLTTLFILISLPSASRAGWLWSSSSGSGDSIMPHALPYAGEALKGLYDANMMKDVPKKLDEYSNKATEALKQIQNNPGVTNDLKEAAMEAMKTGNIDKVTELMGDNKVVSDEALKLAKQSLESYGSAYESYAEYFYQLSPSAGGGKPTGQLAKRIESDFGSFDKFKSQFVESANWVWGSSFVWLVSDKSGKLSIETSRFQSRPAQHKKVILSLYMWERVIDSSVFNGDYKAYADKFFQYVGWDTVNKRYEEWLNSCNKEGKKQEL